MRKLTDHIVENDAANHQITINVLDEPGQGNACHDYRVEGPVLNDDQWHIFIPFQNSPIKEPKDVNGVTQEALLAIVIDRLRGFQSGQYACRENAIALTHCEDALMWLQRRTRARITRGVEGTHTV